MPERYVCLICHHEIPHAGAECPHCRSRRAESLGATPQLLAAIFAVMVVLFTITSFLNRAFRAEMVERARIHLEQAETLADYGYFERAIEQYRESLTYSREAIAPRLGLAQALYRLERYKEAETHLFDLRAREPTLAVVNLLLARLAAREGRRAEAMSFYRAAVFGQWPRNAEENRLQTRFELVEYLEREGENLQALGELIELREEAPQNPDLLLRIARLFLNAGGPDNASEVFQEVIEADPRNGEAYLGRAEAEFELRNFLTARTHLRRALQLLEPDGPQYQRGEMLLATANEVIALDPTYRAISAAERRRRSLALVERVMQRLKWCLGAAEDFIGPPEPAPPALESLFAEAEQRMNERAPRGNAEEWVERNMLLAEGMWGARSMVCENGEDRLDPLALVLEKLAQ